MALSDGATLPVTEPPRARGAGYWVPFLGLLLFTAVLPIENVFSLPLLGSLGRITGLLLLVLALPTFVARGRFVLRAPPVTLVFLGAFALWALASLLWSHDPTRTLVYATTMVQLFLLATILWQLCRTPAERLLVMQAYVIGACVAIGSAVANLMAGREAVFGRFSAPGTDPNDFALMVVLAVPMAWEVAARATYRGAALNLLFLPAAALAVVISGSRGGAIALAVALLVVPFGLRLLPRPRRRLLVAILLGALALLPFLWSRFGASVARNVERLMNTASDAVSGSLNVRDVIWAAGLDLIQERPLLGVGGGAFASALETATGMAEVAHNTMLSVTVELGVVGFCLLAGALLASALPLLASRNAGALPSLVLLLTWLVGTSALSWEMRKATWIVLMLASTFQPVLLARVPRAAARFGPRPPEGEGLAGAPGP